MIRFFASAMVALACAGLAACERKPSSPAPAAAPRPGSRTPRVTTTTVIEKEVVFVVEAAGSIEAAEEIRIPARVAGILDSVSFKEGDRVTPDTVLAEIDLERHRLDEARALAEFHRAEAQESLQARLFANRQKLYDEGKERNKDWVTEEQMATWRADLEKAKADREQTDAGLRLARRNLRDATVHPPRAGLIQQRHVSGGEYVKSETVIATMLNVSTLYVRFSVSEEDASRLAAGQGITFSIAGEPGRDFPAKLFHLSQKADETTRAVECKAEVAGPPPGLRPGNFASVRAVTGRQKARLVPERAVLPTQRGFVVYTLEGKKAVPRPVKPGPRTEGGVSILEGLKAGETIVVDGASALRPGVEVEIVEQVK